MKTSIVICSVIVTLAAANVTAAGENEFTGLNVNMSNLPLLSNAKSRSVSPENLTGEKGRGGMATLETGSAAYAARELGRGWKVNPYVHIEPGQTFTMANITGPGAIKHIWMTPTGNNRLTIFRFYWDGEEKPSIECPVGDFFACGLGQYAQVNSLAVCVNPKSGFNCYWTMPFRKSCKITMTNIDDKRMTLYYQIDYILTDVPETAAYLHAQFRRVNPLPDKEDYTILDGVKGRGQYVGTYMTWVSKSPGWWGEGEIKFYIDGDTEFPTICGTGTEDYFCGSYGFDNPAGGGYKIFSTPYVGMPQTLYTRRKPTVKSKIIKDGQIIGEKVTKDTQPPPRFSLYRWHITDPVRFQQDLKVTMQALGWQSEGRYLPLSDDISSVAFWYQTEPHSPYPELPDKDHLRLEE